MKTETVQFKRMIRPHTWVSCRICHKSGHWAPNNMEICEHRQKLQGLCVDDLIERVYYMKGEIIVNKDGVPTTYNSKYELTYPFVIGIHGTGCGGYATIYTGDRIINGKRFPAELRDPELAWMLALVQWVEGYKHYDNSSPLRNLCTCDTRINELETAIKQMPIVSLGSWNAVGGIGNRGITDYQRMVIVSKPLTTEQENILREYIEIYKNPGYCNKTMRKENDGYVFTSTMDSSD